jgi:Phenylalanyl-tRNA synthetase beta subunit
MIGYDNIKSIPLKIISSFESQQDKISKITSFLVNNGFLEVINFPFTANEEKNSILIDNPLDSNRKNLRTSLKDSLIENLLFNERRQKDSIKLFEISDVYSSEKDIHQEKRLAIIVSGRLGHNHKDFSKKLDRSYLNEILNLKHNISIFDIEEIPRENLKTKKKEKIFFSEILVEDIPYAFLEDQNFSKTATNFIKYQPVSEFPSSVRDFSFSIKNLEIFNLVISHIEKFHDENLKESFIFDFYRNEKLGEIKLGIRLIFQSPTKTLSDDDIQMSIDNILKPVINLDGVFIPGLELK